MKVLPIELEQNELVRIRPEKETKQAAGKKKRRKTGYIGRLDSERYSGPAKSPAKGNKRAGRKEKTRRSAAEERGAAFERKK